MRNRLVVPSNMLIYITISYNEINICQYRHF